MSLCSQLCSSEDVRVGRDAQEAVRGRDGYDYDGYRLRVELSHGARGGAPAAPPTFRGKGSR